METKTTKNWWSSNDRNNPNRSIPDKATWKKPWSQILVCQTESRNYFHFRNDEVIHMPGIKHECQTLGIVQLLDKGVKLVGLIQSTGLSYFQNTKFCASIQAAMATWYICSWVSFPITICWDFSSELCPTSKLWLLRQHLSLKRSDWFCLSGPRQGLFWEDQCATARVEVLGRLKRYPRKQGEKKELCWEGQHAFVWGRWDGLWVGGSRLSAGS